VGGGRRGPQQRSRLTNSTHRLLRAEQTGRVLAGRSPAGRLRCVGACAACPGPAGPVAHRPSKPHRAFFELFICVAAGGEPLRQVRCSCPTPFLFQVLLCERLWAVSGGRGLQLMMVRRALQGNCGLCLQRRTVYTVCAAQSRRTYYVQSSNTCSSTCRLLPGTPPLFVPLSSSLTSPRRPVSVRYVSAAVCICRVRICTRWLRARARSSAGCPCNRPVRPVFQSVLHVPARCPRDRPPAEAAAGYLIRPHGAIARVCLAVLLAQSRASHSRCTNMHEPCSPMGENDNLPRAGTADSLAHSIPARHSDESVSVRPLRDVSWLAEQTPCAPLVALSCPPCTALFSRCPERRSRPAMPERPIFLDSQTGGRQTG
jgi:hypothetical protein